MPGGTQKQKYEREIAEILERMERDEPRTERVKRQARTGVWQRWQAWRSRSRRARDLSFGPQAQYGPAAAWTWIGLTLGIGVAGLLLGSISPFLGLLCGIAMVAMFFSPLLRRLSGPSSPSPSNMWRGKVIDLPPRSGLFATLRYHWRRFRHGRRP
ncbi:MAG: hypothetical protein M3Q65_08905 [Chloroflexota bacterium]|nr:hypothetical protein [Chloroflexota bacterium]